MGNSTRRGLTNYELNKDGRKFISTEIAIIMIVIALFTNTNWGWNIFATMIIGGIILYVMVFAKIYLYIGYLVSIVWGCIGYELAKYVTVWTGGGDTLGTVMGAVAFAVGYLITIGMRLAGVEYYDDIGKD